MRWQPEEDTQGNQLFRCVISVNQLYFTDANHGTSTYASEGQLFDELQLFEGDDLTRSVSRSLVGKLGVSIAHQPKAASDFVRQANPIDGVVSAILPLRFRSDKVCSIVRPLLLLK